MIQDETDVVKFYVGRLLEVIPTDLNLKDKVVDPI